MTRHYSPRSFFRHVPIDLLARYSESRGLGRKLDFAAWLELPMERQRALEAEFRQIFEMSSREGNVGHSRRGSPAVAGRPRPIDRLHRNPVVAARPLPPGDGNLPGPPGMLEGRHPGPSRRDPSRLAQAQAPGGTGRQRRTRPASNIWRI